MVKVTYGGQEAVGLSSLEAEQRATDFEEVLLLCRTPWPSAPTGLVSHSPWRTDDTGSNTRYALTPPNDDTLGRPTTDQRNRSGTRHNGPRPTTSPDPHHNIPQEQFISDQSQLDERLWRGPKRSAIISVDRWSTRITVVHVSGMNYDPDSTAEGGDWPKQVRSSEQETADRAVLIAYVTTRLLTAPLQFESKNSEQQTTGYGNYAFPNKLTIFNMISKLKWTYGVLKYRARFGKSQSPVVVFIHFITDDWKGRPLGTLKGDDNEMFLLQKSVDERKNIVTLGPSPNAEIFIDPKWFRLVAIATAVSSPGPRGGPLAGGLGPVGQPGDSVVKVHRRAVPLTAHSTNRYEKLKTRPPLSHQSPEATEYTQTGRTRTESVPLAN
ncbi:hypothetical protein AAG570_003609 [Ranatra chinensis]|uniref:Uncharacterized protein n=1 Tax=Ranatra chinensis TaxID=642074 RepID=A0ABD0YSP1_9HEMI